MISISEKAASKIDNLRTESGFTPDYNLRVSVVSGGCSGLSYKIDFDKDPLPTDEVIEDKGFKILVDKKSFFYLVGTELDYSDGLQGKGFNFRNPNASRTCGCGESFSL